MVRQAKSLQHKAKHHEVQPVGRGKFRVTSSSSRKSYLVFAVATGSWQCTCEWSKYHRTDFEPCSHVLSVEEYLEQSGLRRLSFWAEDEDAQRQHRPMQRVGRGLWATSRRQS